MLPSARLVSGLVVAAALHAGLLVALSMLRGLDLEVRPFDASGFDLALARPTASEPPSAEPPPSAKKQIAAAAPHVTTGRRATAAALPPTEAPKSPIRSVDDGPIVVSAQELAAADGILGQLGGSAVADTSEGGVNAPGPPVVLPVPLGDYAHAKVSYPDEAVDSLASGQVFLELDVDEHGAVKGVRPHGHLGHGFDELATNLATGYRFRPARDDKGREVAARIGWRMSFAPWQPGASTERAAASSGLPPSGVVPVESLPRASRGDGAEPAPARPPTLATKAPLSRKDIAALPIATLSEPQRHELCQWQIRLRGGVHLEKCYGGPAREDELNKMVGSGPDSNGGMWVRERGSSADLTEHTSKNQAGDDVMVFVKPEAECVKETHTLDQCGATLGRYTECMIALAKNPCGWRRIPACYRLSTECR